MQGLMQDVPLSLPIIMDGIETRFAHKQVKTHSITGESTTITYGEVADRIRRLAGVLDTLEVPNQARVATFAWNTHRHLELYMAVPCSNRILHTVNHRLFAEDIEYIVGDAEDDTIFIDRSILGALLPILDKIPTVRHIVVMDDGVGPETPEGDDRFHDYETLLADASPVMDFDVPNERQASAMCYTSGTTGRPKGVLYDHRSMFLHAMAIQFADTLAISEADRVLGIVPMFHVNSWGVPYAAMMCGADLVLPGNAMTPDLLAKALVEDECSIGLAVPTLWRGIFPHVQGKSLPKLRRLVSGGAPIPVELSRDYQREIGVPLSNAWGMTETSPLVSTGHIPSDRQDASDDEKVEMLALAGITIPIVRVRIVDEFGEIVAQDGESTGELQCRGATIASGYYGVENSGSFTEDGWLKTGDVATIDSHGNITIVDRTKDLIKTGGEWISSAELENWIAAAPDVAEAAVIGRPDPKWDERPVGIVVPAEGHNPTPDTIREYLKDKVAKFWIPEDYVFVDELPKTATGKINKVTLRKAHVN